MSKEGNASKVGLIIVYPPFCMPQAAVGLKPLLELAVSVRRGQMGSQGSKYWGLAIFSSGTLTHTVGQFWLRVGKMWAQGLV